MITLVELNHPGGDVQSVRGAENEINALIGKGFALVAMASWPTRGSLVFALSGPDHDAPPVADVMGG